MGDDGLGARRAALRAIRKVEDEEAYSNLVVPAAVAGLDDARDRAFASHLAYDTLRWRGTLDWALEAVVDRGLDSVEPDLQSVLRLGALQLLLARVPAHAAVATSADLARESVPARRGRGAAGFVNGVLRALSRRLGGAPHDLLPAGDLPWPDPAEEPVAFLELVTGHPGWIVTELVERLGYEEARAALDADNEPPGLTLRAVVDRDALLGELEADGLEATPGRHAPEAVRAPGVDPRQLAAVREGRAVPQDEASMLVARQTRVTTGGRVLDVCAGPGGKATHLASLSGPEGTVVALDVHPHRAGLVRDVAALLDVRVLVAVADGRDPPVRGDFDVVLVDVPCTGLGTGRRRPEVRWRRDAGDVTDLASLQTELLAGAATRVRPGGHLTYSACTWTAAETTGVVHRFVSDAPFDLVDDVQYWPHRDGTDGMYRATLVRRS